MQGLPITAKIKDWVKYANIYLYFLKKYNYLVISFSIKMLLPFLIAILPTIVQSPPLWPLYFTFSLCLFPLLNHYLISTLLNFSTQISSPKDNFLIKNTILTTGWLFTDFILLVFFFCFNNILFFLFNKKLTLSFYSSSLFYNYLYLFFIFITFLSWLIFYLFLYRINENIFTIKNTIIFMLQVDRLSCFGNDQFLNFDVKEKSIVAW